MDKIKFVGGVIAAVTVVYVILTIAMPTITGIAYETANNSSVAAYADAQAGLRWTPIVLYTIPGVVGAGAIGWKLRKGNNE